MIEFLHQNPEDAAMLRLPSKFKLGSKAHKRFEKVFKSMDTSKSQSLSWQELAAHFEFPPAAVDGVQGLTIHRPQTPGANSAQLGQDSPLVPEGTLPALDTLQAPRETFVRSDRVFSYPYDGISSSATAASKGCSKLKSGENTWNFWEQSGCTYEGKRVNGHECGAGEWHEAGNTLGYTGTWLEGKREDQGTQELVGGGTYNGNWKANRYSGPGVLTQANGLHYDGEWFEHKRQGFGKQVYAETGNSYMGEWNKDQREGWGKFEWNEKVLSTYVGQFSQDMIDGYGTLSTAAHAGVPAASFKGEFRKGKFMRRLASLGRAVESVPPQMEAMMAKELLERQQQAAALKIQCASRSRKAKKRVQQQREKKGAASEGAAPEGA